jgi:hypothetical protein
MAGAGTSLSRKGPQVNRICTAIAFCVVIASAVLLAQPQPQPIADPPMTVGLALYNYTNGNQRTIAKGDLYFANGELAHGILNPASALLCQTPCAGGRWGWDRRTKGPMVGPEGTHRAIAQAALDSGCLSIPGLPANYQLTQLDYEDLMYARWGNTSWYDARVIPCTRPTPTPTPRPTPSPTPSPLPTPTPPELCCMCPDYERAGVPEYEARTLEILGNKKGPITSWQTAIQDRVDRLIAWAAGVDETYYVPTDYSSGRDLTTCVEEP